MLIFSCSSTDPETGKQVSSVLVNIIYSYVVSDDEQEPEPEGEADAMDTDDEDDSME